MEEDEELQARPASPLSLLIWLTVLGNKGCATDEFADLDDGRTLCRQMRVLKTTHSLLVSLCLVLLAVVGFLLALGAAKALLGLCHRPIGMFGLAFLLGLPQPMDHYFEPGLRHQDVVCDEEGWPVHPATRRRTVRALSLHSELCTNVIFFMVYPAVMCLRLCCCSYFLVPDDLEAKGVRYEFIQSVTYVAKPSGEPCFPDPEDDCGCAAKTTVWTDYYDRETDEEKDAKFVREELTKSENELRQGRM